MFLEVDALTVRYEQRAGTRAAVQRATFGLQAGEIGVLIGPSGCGKTSLLRAIAGLERCAEGRVRVGGEQLDDAARGLHLAPERRRIGMVFQDYALFPHLTVADNIAFGLHGLPSVERQARVQEVLDLVGVANAEKRAHQQLYAPRPRLLLLDEPFSSLDIDLRERLAQDLRGILKASGTTALFVTHDQMEAFALGDLIGVMNAGVLEQWADAYTLYHRPQTRFVARFIGHGVFAPARIVAGSPSPHVQTALGALDDAAECPLPDAFPEGECDILLRADDIVHDDLSPVKARIERKAFRGSEFLYTLRLDSGEQVLAHVPSHHDHAVGESIGIRAEVDHVVTFPREATPGHPNPG